MQHVQILKEVLHVNAMMVIMEVVLLVLVINFSFFFSLDKIFFKKK